MIPPSAIGVMGLLGPVRRRATLTYTGTCPNCRTPEALTVQVTPTGELPSCRHCLAADVAAAIKTGGVRV